MGRLRDFKFLLLSLVLLALLVGFSSSLPTEAKNQQSLIATLYSNAVRFTTPLQNSSAIRVEVFDLQGARLFDSGPVFSRSVDWQLTDQLGLRVSKGVYLYVATIWNGEGQELKRSLGKIAVIPEQRGVTQAVPPLNEQIGISAGRELGLTPLAFNGTDFFISGRLGVGTDAPATSGPSLHILQTDPNVSPQLRLEVNGANPKHFPNIRFFNGTTAVGQLIADAAVGRFVFDYCAACGGDFTVRKVVDSSDPADVVLTSNNAGQIGIGTNAPQAKLDIVGTETNLIRAADAANPSNAVFRVQKDGNVYADGSYNCGLSSQGACFVAGSGADVAERIDASETLVAGDVVEIDPDHPGQFRLAQEARSTRVAGVISTAPAVTLGNNFDPVADQWEDARPLIALAGRVPVKVTDENGPIQIGDLLVASSTPGYAMRCASDCIGAVVGKALEQLSEGEGTVLALVTLR